MNFQKIIVVISTILLIITLAIFAYTLHNNKVDEKYPPVEGQCPDYWTMKRGDDGVPMCVNDMNLGSPNCLKEMNFQKSPFIGPHGACNKQKWSNSCKITWDGITNAAGIC